MWRVEWCGVDLAPGIRYCWGVLLRSFRRHYGVVVQARVEDDPRDQESGKRRHEPLLDQLPYPSVGVLVHVLKVYGVQVDDPAADAGESGGALD